MVVGEVFMQQGRSIAYYSQVKKGRTLLLSIFEKEFSDLVLDVQKWRPYLIGRTFVVKIDHQSLKYLLDQRVGTPI